MKVYHGTNSEFQKFDFGKLGDNTLDMSPAGVMGAFFTNSLRYASDYAAYAAQNGGEPTILVANIKIENPADYNNIDLEALESPEAALELKEMLIAEGYDGLRIDTSYGETEYCVFSQNQIKSIKKHK